MGPLAPITRRALLASSLGILCCLAVSSGAEPAPAESGAAAPDSSAVESSPRYRLEPVVVTAERAPVPLARVPADVTVLDRSLLGPERGFFAADALRQTPAIDVQRSGTLGKVTDVRLRGADPRHTLVLFDGIPLNGPWLGSFDFSDLPAAGFARAEIVGGPASSPYSAKARARAAETVSSGRSWITPPTAPEP